MIVIAKGSIPRPDALAPHLDDEMRVLRELKAEGVVKSAYRRAAGPGFYFLLEGPSIRDHNARRGGNRHLHRHRRERRHGCPLHPAQYH